MALRLPRKFSHPATPFDVRSHAHVLFFLHLVPSPVSFFLCVNVWLRYCCSTRRTELPFDPRQSAMSSSLERQSSAGLVCTRCGRR